MRLDPIGLLDLLLPYPLADAVTLGLTIRDDPAYPFQAQGQTLCKPYGGHTITAVPIPHPKA
jgi:hypothetical protein